MHERPSCDPGNAGQRDNWDGLSAAMLAVARRRAEHERVRFPVVNVPVHELPSLVLGHWSRGAARDHYTWLCELRTPR